MNTTSQAEEGATISILTRESLCDSAARGDFVKSPIVSPNAMDLQPPVWSNEVTAEDRALLDAMDLESQPLSDVLDSDILQASEAAIFNPENQPIGETEEVDITSEAQEQANALIGYRQQSETIASGRQPVVHEALGQLVVYTPPAGSHAKTEGPVQPELMDQPQAQSNSMTMNPSEQFDLMEIEPQEPSGHIVRAGNQPEVLDEISCSATVSYEQLLEQPQPQIEDNNPEDRINTVNGPHELKDVVDWKRRCVNGTIYDLKRSELRKKYRNEDLPETFLHVLPGELRQRIYDLIGLPRIRQTLIGLKQINLADGIPSLQPELHAMMFAQCRFEVDAYSKFMYQDSLLSQGRVPTRGGRYGAGKLALPPNSWIRHADVLAVKFHHVCIHICEMDGSHICDLFLNIKNTGNRRGPNMLVKGITSQDVRIRLHKARRRAAGVVAALGRQRNFVGFSLDHLTELAEIYRDPESIK